jgi:hypothetical protein
MIIGPPINPWQLLEFELRYLEVCFSRLQSISEEPAAESFCKLIDLLLDRLNTITCIEERLVERIAEEVNIDKNGNLRSKMTEIVENSKPRPAGNTFSFSPEAA